MSSYCFILARLVMPELQVRSQLQLQQLWELLRIYFYLLQRDFWLDWGDSWRKVCSVLALRWNSSCVEERSCRWSLRWQGVASTWWRVWQKWGSKGLSRRVEKQRDLAFCGTYCLFLRMFSRRWARTASSSWTHLGLKLRWDMRCSICPNYLIRSWLNFFLAFPPVPLSSAPEPSSASSHRPCIALLISRRFACSSFILASPSALSTCSRTDLCSQRYLWLRLVGFTLYSGLSPQRHSSPCKSTTSYRIFVPWAEINAKVPSQKRQTPGSYSCNSEYGGWVQLLTLCAYQHSILQLFFSKPRLSVGRMR